MVDEDVTEQRAGTLHRTQHPVSEEIAGWVSREITTSYLTLFDYL